MLQEAAATVSLAVVMENVWRTYSDAMVTMTVRTFLTSRTVVLTELASPILSFAKVLHEFALTLLPFHAPLLCNFFIYAVVA